MKSRAQNRCMYSTSSGVTVPRAQSTAPSALAAHASAGTTSGPQAGAIAVQERRHGHRREDSGDDEHRGVREPGRDDAGEAQAKCAPLSRAVLLDRESQDDQQERHGHVRRVGLRLRRVEDERDPRRQEPEGERRAEARRKHAPGDLPAERQRREAPEERDQAQRVLALSEDENGELLEHEPARRRDLAIVERAQEACQRALDDVQGHVRLVGPERRAGRVLPEPQGRAERAQRHRNQPRRTGRRGRRPDPAAAPSGSATARPAMGAEPSPRRRAAIRPPRRGAPPDRDRVGGPVGSIGQEAHAARRLPFRSGLPGLRRGRGARVSPRPARPSRARVVVTPRGGSIIRACGRRACPR